MNTRSVWVFGLVVAAIGGLGCGSDDDLPPSQMSAGMGGSDAPDAAEIHNDAATPARSGVHIYATVSGAHELAVIDEGSRDIVDRIPVGQGPAILLATPGEEKLYTANWRDNTVSSVVRASKTVKNIAMSGRPYVIALSPSGDKLYVGTNPTGIVVVDTETDEIESTWPTNELAASLIVSPDGATLYVATISIVGPGTLRAISTATGEVVHAPINVGSSPAWITINPDGSKVFTLNFLSDDISVVDTATFAVVHTVSTGPGSQAIIGNVTPDGSRLYVTNHGTGELMAIDTQTYAIVQTIQLDGRPVGVSFNAAGTRVYTTDFGTASLAAAPDLGYLLSGTLSATGPGQVRVFDVATGEAVGATVETGPGATSVIVHGP